MGIPESIPGSFYTRVVVAFILLNHQSPSARLTSLHQVRPPAAPHVRLCFFHSFLLSQNSPDTWRISLLRFLVTQLKRVWRKWLIYTRDILSKSSVSCR